MMGLDATRVRAVVDKELRDFRRTRSIVVTMAVLPVVFLIQPTLAVLLGPPPTSNGKYFGLPILILLLIPVIMPSTLAAYSVVGEREQGTLEPLLTKPAIASGVFHQGPVLLALFLFTPLLAGWAIVVGMAVSVRAKEVRVAQQLGTLASFPPLGVVVLFGIGVIHPTLTVAVLFAIGLLVIDVRAVRVVSQMFDRERLLTGARAARS